MTHLWLKALHVISVIAWMAGILYYWRLLVYHAMETEAVVIERFVVMERRLRNAIMTPAMIATWVFGIAMLVNTPDFLKQPWMHLKLSLVLVLSGNHGMAIWATKRLIAQPGSIGHKAMRVMNEVPTLLMIIIVILVILKPFGG